MCKEAEKDQISYNYGDKSVHMIVNAINSTDDKFTSTYDNYYVLINDMSSGEMNFNDISIDREHPNKESSEEQQGEKLENITINTLCQIATPPLHTIEKKKSFMGNWLMVDSAGILIL